MAFAMLILPQIIVVGWSMMERDIGRRLQEDVGSATLEASEALRTADGPSKLDAIASRWSTRLRVVRDDGVVVYDGDADRGTDLVHQIGTLFFGPDGAPTLREFDDTLGAVEDRPEAIAARGAPGVGCRTSPGAKLLVCHSARVATFDERPHVIYAQESSRRAVRVLYDLRYHLARLSIVMLPFALGFSWWMGRRMARPIEWLRERVVEKARSANPRADIALRGDAEVQDLAEAFNGLLGALDERRRANEAFVADLVHEFKNPVAAIRACAESLGTGSADAQRALRLSKILADSSTRLDALVSQFLELARAEAGMPREDRDVVDLGALTAGIVSAAVSASPDVHFVVETELANVVGVASRIDSLVRNLVDNAASFAGKDGEVRVIVRLQDTKVLLEVGDSGPGIAPEDLPHVFDRFFTKRGSGHERRGSGLGLALVKAVAEAHGGEVSATSKLGEGAIFRVVLPLRA